jgi:hypothetical protein
LPLAENNMAFWRNARALNQYVQSVKIGVIADIVIVGDLSNEMCGEGRVWSWKLSDPALKTLKSQSVASIN